MTKTLLGILKVVFLVSLFRFIGQTIRSGVQAVGRLFIRRSPASTAAEQADKTIEISDEMIMQNADTLDLSVGKSPKKCPKESSDMVRNMEILEDTSLVEPFVQPDTAIIRESIEEVDFYMEQDLLTDARMILDELSKRAPNHQLLKCKRHQLNHVAKINRPGVVPPDDQPTRIVDYSQIAASRTAAK